MNKTKPENKPLAIDGTAAVPVGWFGKDHLSLLGYIGSRVESHGAGDGTVSLDKVHLRCNPERHPVHAVSLAGERTWKESYGTKLAGFWKEDGMIDPSLQIHWHDDWDCLDDLESAGLIKVISEINAFVTFTMAGLAVYGKLAAHKASGKNYSEFRM